MPGYCPCRSLLVSVVGVQTQVIVLPFIIIIHQRSWNVDSLVVVQVITSSIV